MSDAHGLSLKTQDKAQAAEARRAAAYKLAELSRPQPEQAAAAQPAAWVETAHEQSREWTRVSLALIDFAEANVKRNLEFTRALMTAPSLKDAIARHEAFMQATIDAYKAQMGELKALLVKA